MTRITRYLLAELLKVLVIALVGMTLFMLLVGVVETARREGLGLAPIARLLPYLIPEAMRFAIPGTVLFAACSVYGRVADSNEVLAVKSLGVSPLVMLWPAFCLAFLISLLTVWINDLAVTWGRRGVQRVLLQSIEEIAYGRLRTERTFRPTDKLTIGVQDVVDRRLIGPTISLHGSDSAPAINVFAAEAELRYNPERNVLSVYLNQAEIFSQYGEQVQGFFPTWERDIPLTFLSDSSPETTRPQDTSLGQIPGELARQGQEIKRLERELAADSAFHLLSGDFEALESRSWKDRREKLNGAYSRVYRLQTEPWRRWANGFSCFFFVLVGAPLAIRMRNADVFKTFMMCFFPILILYYPLLMYGVSQAKGGRLPPYCVWLGNVILAAAGAWLVRLVCRGTEAGSRWKLW